MNSYEIAKAAAWEIYAEETSAAGDNYNGRAIALANYYRALGKALEEVAA